MILSKLLIEEPLVKNAGWEDFLTIRPWECDGVLESAIGVVKKDEEEEGWTYPSDFGVVTVETFRNGVLGNTGIVAWLEGLGKETGFSDRESAANSPTPFQPSSNPGGTVPTGQEGRRLGDKGNGDIPFRFPSTLGETSSIWVSNALAARGIDAPTGLRPLKDD